MPPKPRGLTSAEDVKLSYWHRVPTMSAMTSEALALPVMRLISLRGYRKSVHTLCRLP